ncbi:NADH-ubiquinone oxidoreductase-F iron-sulfur binding region domain-containing protein [Ralstonia pseudosolanacearum]|uniref:NADH-ubiquinone oxidoreductase-F iron-sulfur binding region domain-containing protein n=1 Tax=Ralstonia pseudosolanacearum TaxID=1310165 RepID=UPI001FFB2ADC|nr:NADH-ubiquinone oxidoreductase-F iron-sulfur binding region domain-containing protein [Ralstonia pseudosolanacearum]
MERLNQRLLHPAFNVGADYDRWIAAGGGAGLEIALANPASIIDTIESAGLAGMGGAGFPTHRKWRAAAAQTAGVKYVVVNGNEDEPGTFKDGLLLARTPHQVVEGALIAALAIRATHVVFYVNPRIADGLAALEEAIGQWRASPLVERLAATLGHPVALAVARSSGRYIGGEATAIVSSLEGRFPFPHRKPPHPTESGIGGAPTLINNAETIAHVPHILREGPAAYRALGIGEACGTKLYSLSGDVLRPGLYELPMGTSLRELVFAHGGGMLGGKAFKAVFTGGPSNTLLTAADLDVALDFASVRARGSNLGTGAMIVIGEGTSIVREVTRYVEFFAVESCGQCPPCKCGTFQMARLLHRIDTGAASRRDVTALKSLCETLPGSGRCALIDGAVTVVESSLRTFPREYGLDGAQERCDIAGKPAPAALAQNA